MTAPAMPQQPQTALAPRQFAGRRASSQTLPSSPGGDGAPQAQGAQVMPRPQFHTANPPSPQGQPAPPPPQTFAQMQQAGQARPAPQQAMTAPVQNPPLQSSLQDTVAQHLANPSAYTSQNAVDTFNRLNQTLGEQYKQQQSQLNDEMAKRGISDSTIAGQRYSDLGTEQARAQANLVQQIQTQAAQQYGSDYTGAVNAGLGLGSLGVAQQGANTAQQGMQNQFSLGQGQLGLQGQLGMGQLGVAQQQVQNEGAYQQGQLGLGQGQLSLQQAAQSQNYGLAQQAQALQQQVQTGQLSIAQANQQLAQLQNSQQYGLAGQQLDLSKQLGLGNLSLAQQAQQNQASQFGQSLGLQQSAQDAQKEQFGQSLGLQSQLGLGNLANQQQQTANQASQFGQSFGLQQSAQDAQKQQFADSLAQQLGLATMSDKTANRGVDAQSALANNQLIYQVLGAMGNIDPTVLKGILAKLGSGDSTGVTSGKGGTGGTGNGGTGVGDGKDTPIIPVGANLQQQLAQMGIR